MPRLCTLSRAGFQVGAGASGPRNPAPAGGGGDVLLVTFDAENFNAGAASNVSRCFGVGLAQGDCPVGFYLVLKNSGGTEIPATWGQRVTWHGPGQDGSLKWAACFPRDTDLSASEVRTYSVYRRSGSFDDTNALSLATFLSGIDPQVAFSSMTQTNDSTTTARGSGAALSKLSVDAAVSTRVTVACSGPTYKKWYIWGMARDGATGAGAEDPDLKIEWECEAWTDSGGSVTKRAVMAIVTLDWFQGSQPTKQRLNYTAAFKDGASTLDTYSSLEHCYNQRWATAKTSADAHSGKSYVFTGALDTCNHIPDQEYLYNAKLVPTLDYESTLIEVSPGQGNGSNVTFAPLTIQGQRSNGDDTGAYVGRGLVTQQDACWYMRLGLGDAASRAQDARIGRVNMHVGNHEPIHWRSIETRTRPGEGTPDIANTMMPIQLDTLSGAGDPDEWLADGMPTATVYGSGKEFPEGYNSSISPSLDCSHAVNFAYFAYLMEGQYWGFQIMCSNQNWTNLTPLADFADNIYGGRPFSPGYLNTIRRGVFSIPATQWSGIQPTWESQERSNGWGMLLVGIAAAMRPDDCVEAGFIDDYAAQNSAYYANGVDNCTDATQKASGQWSTYRTAGAGGITDMVMAQWQHDMNSANASWMNEMTGLFAEIADQLGRFIVGQLTGGNFYRCAVQDGSACNKAAFFNPATSSYYTPASEFKMQVTMSVDVSENEVTFVGPNPGQLVNYWPIRNGDIVWMSRIVNSSPTEDTDFPPPLVEETPYYLVNVTPGQPEAQLSLTEGGAAVTLTGSDVNQNVFLNLRGGVDALVSPEGIEQNYYFAALWAITQQARRGFSGAAALAADYRTFMEGMSDMEESGNYNYKLVT